MDKQFNEGYLLIERCGVEDSVFVIGYNHNGNKPFAVWEYANEAFIHPGYFDTKMQALSDFGHRIKSQADFHIRNALPARVKPVKPPVR